MIGLALPVWSHIFNNDAGIFRRYLERRLDTIRQLFNGKIQKIAVQLRIQDAVSPLLADSACNQLVVINIDRAIFCNMAHSFRPSEHQRLPLGRLHRFGKVLCTLNIDFRFFGDYLPKDAECPRTSEILTFACHLLLQALFVGG